MRSCSIFLIVICVITDLYERQINELKTENEIEWELLDFQTRSLRVEFEIRQKLLEVRRPATLFELNERLPNSESIFHANCSRPTRTATKESHAISENSIESIRCTESLHRFDSIGSASKRWIVARVQHQLVQSAFHREIRISITRHNCSFLGTTCMALTLPSFRCKNFVHFFPRIRKGKCNNSIRPLIIAQKQSHSRKNCTTASPRWQMASGRKTWKQNEFIEKSEFEKQSMNSKRYRNCTSRFRHFKRVVQNTPETN